MSCRPSALPSVLALVACLAVGGCRAAAVPVEPGPPSVVADSAAVPTPAAESAAALIVPAVATVMPPGGRLALEPDSGRGRVRLAEATSGPVGFARDAAGGLYALADGRRIPLAEGRYVWQHYPPPPGPRTTYRVPALEAVGDVLKVPLTYAMFGIMALLTGGFHA